MLFAHDINSKNEWTVAKNEASLIFPLVKYICQKVHISTEHLRQQNPSTNAVFRSDNKIIKIYAPANAGYQAELDYLREVYALNKISCPSIRSPELIEAGCLQDKYDFYYTVQSFIQGIPADTFLDENGQKGLFKFCDDLNLFLEYLRSIKVEKSDLSLLSEETINDKKISTTSRCSFFVHSDISCSNVLINKGKLAVIDFEDWFFAPACAEYPAIVFDLFKLHADAIRVFFKREISIELACIIANGICCHRDSYNFARKINCNWGKENVTASTTEMAYRFFSILKD